MMNSIPPASVNIDSWGMGSTSLFKQIRIEFLGNGTPDAVLDIEGKIHKMHYSGPKGSLVIEDEANVWLYPVRDIRGITFIKRDRVYE